MQTLVSPSSAEAKYQAIAHITREMKWLKSPVREKMVFWIVDHCLYFVISGLAICIAINSSSHGRN